ncbi:MAG: HAD family phosphatase [Planctomycetales bacterium]|nr:HAD family phosphatase [Planctomycetales bacterium]
MEIAAKLLKNMGNSGKQIKVDGAVPHFIDYLAENGRTANSLYMRPNVVAEWHEKAKNDQLQLNSGTLMRLCLLLNVWPHKRPRLIIIPQEFAEVVWRDWQDEFKDWVPAGKQGFDEENFREWLKARGLHYTSIEERSDRDAQAKNFEASHKVEFTVIPSNPSAIGAFIQKNGLIEASSQIDLFMYTAETIFINWRDQLFRQKSDLRIRLLMRRPETDVPKQSLAEGTLVLLQQIQQTNRNLDIDVHFYNEDPTFRLYFFCADRQSLCLAGFYHFDRMNPVRFVGAEDSFLFALHGESNTKLLRSRFDFAWDSTSAIRAVMFDMDGVLVDGMPHHLAAWREAFRFANVEFEEGDFTREVYLREGENVTVTARELFEKYAGARPDAAMIELILSKRKEIHFDLARNIDAMPGVFELIDALRAKGIPLSVVTGSTSEVANSVISRLFPGRFSVVVSGDDTVNGKPDPAPYILARERLGIAQQQRSKCIVVENAPLGVQSAFRAGAYVIGVLLRSPLTPTNLVDSGARCVCTSHSDVAEELLSIRYGEMSL